MKYCPKCGSEMDDDLELCPKCSAESEQQVPEEPAQEAAAAVDAAEVSAPEQTEKPPESAPEAAECEYSETTVEPSRYRSCRCLYPDLRQNRPRNRR